MVSWGSPCKSPSCEVFAGAGWLTSAWLPTTAAERLLDCRWVSWKWCVSQFVCVCLKMGYAPQMRSNMEKVFFCIGFQSCPLAMFSQSYFEADGRDMSGWSMLLVVTRQVHVLSPVQVPVRQVGSAGGWVYAAPLPPMAILGRSGSNSKTPLPDARILLEFHYFK